MSCTAALASKSAAEKARATRSTGLKLPDRRLTGIQPLPRFLQAKLTVGAVDDPLEQQADRVADRVMRMSVSGDFSGVGSTVRRACCSSCEQDEKVQRLRSPSNVSGSSAALGVGHDVTTSAYSGLRSPSKPLHLATLSFMEPRFGSRFDHVRVHTDGRAAESASSLNARAYTVGTDIVFGAGQYAPGTAVGDRLLAHELTHTIQQGVASGEVSRSIALDVSASREIVAQRACSDKSYRNCMGSCVPEGGGTGFCAWSGSIATGCVCYRRDQPMLREIQQALFNAIIAALIVAGIVLTAAAIAAIIACLMGPCELAALAAAIGFAAAVIVLGIIKGTGSSTGGSPVAANDQAQGTGTAPADRATAPA